MTSIQLQVLLIPIATWILCITSKILVPPSKLQVVRSFDCGTPMAAGGVVAAFSFLIQVANSIAEKPDGLDLTLLSRNLNTGIGLLWLATACLFGVMAIQRQLGSQLKQGANKHTIAILCVLLPASGACIQATMIFLMNGVIK